MQYTKQKTILLFYLQNGIQKTTRAHIEKYLQDRQYFKDPVKAKTKKRYVAGLREIKKYLIVKKITALLIAPGNVIIWIPTAQNCETS